MTRTNVLIILIFRWLKFHLRSCDQCFPQLDLLLKHLKNNQINKQKKKAHIPLPWILIKTLQRKYPFKNITGTSKWVVTEG